MPNKGHFNATHGETGSPEYTAWNAMKRRCYNKNYVGRKWYSDRGIEVCDRWRDDFMAFLEDMGRKPSPHHSLDRIDVNLGYSTENCRWSTQKEQTRNKRNNVIMTIDGVSCPVSEWAEKAGLPRYLVWKRYCRWGWTAEQSLSPAGSRRGAGGAQKA